MQYLGGKYKVRKRVAACVARYRRPGQVVWEPFCGGLGSAVAHEPPVICSDGLACVISLYQAVQAGWQPHEIVTEEDYARAKALPDSDPMRAFALLGCAFGGKYDGGYARGATGRNYANESRNALLRDVPRIEAFFRADFLALEPKPIDAVIYCDPPYRGRTGYAGVAFDPDLFVERVLGWAKHAHVLVSEYEFPEGELVEEFTRGACVRGREPTRTERIYHLGPCTRYGGIV